MLHFRGQNYLPVSLAFTQDSMSIREPDEPRYRLAFALTLGLEIPHDAVFIEAPRRREPKPLIEGDSQAIEEETDDTYAVREEAGQNGRRTLLRLPGMYS